MPQFDIAFSLGPGCRTKHQLNRLYGRKNCHRSVFDRQITPVDSIIEYIERDFRGVFDLADLKAQDHHVTNLKYRTIHPHHFKRDITQFGVMLAYPMARLRYSERAASSRSVLNGDKRVLMALESVKDEDVPRLEEAIRQYNPKLDFAIVSVHEEHLPTAPDFRGYDDVWTKALSGFALS